MSAALRTLLPPSGWLAAALLLGSSTNLALHAQDYGQQPYPNQPAYGQPGSDPAQGDPPSRVARVSVVQGNVSLQPSGVEDFSPASLNYPLTTGDRIYSDTGALTELEAGQLAIRLGSATDLSITAMTDQLGQFGLGQGSIHVRSYDLDPNATLEIDTPNVAITVLAPGDLRVDVSPDGTMTQVTLLSGQARVDGPGFQQQLQPGESLQLTGSEPVYAQDTRRPRGDGLDHFSTDRDGAYQNAIAMESDYVNPGTIGAADLGQYGDWNNDGDNGAVWYPRGVAADWQPYSVGRWAYVAPWGWTWVENEPWGFAPFHYGRWARFGPRWGWIPGPRIVRPVYSPALVAFVGGGVGVTAWFPLGPREPYVPWYRTSSLYANRINVTNIYNRNTVEVRNIYNQRTTNVYINNGSPNRGYANRQLATVAIPQNAFAGGRPVHEVAMRVPQQQFANAPVLTHPVGNPMRSIMAPAPARALPPRLNRPPVESRAPAFQPGGANRTDRSRFGNNNGAETNGNNHPGGFGNQPGNSSGGSTIRGNNPQQPGQPPNQGQPTRGAVPFQPTPGGTPSGPLRTNDPVQRPDQRLPITPGNTPGANRPGTGQFPGRGNGEGQAPPFHNEPGRITAPNPVVPGTGTQFPGRGNGAGQAPPFRAEPGRTAAPAPVTSTPPVQLPDRDNREGQSPAMHTGPGRMLSPMQIAPGNQQPLQSNPGQVPRDFRERSGAIPVGVPPERPQQGPVGNVRQWQQQQNTAPAQNHPQPPAQTPQGAPQRFQPQPAPQPALQPQRQFNVPPPAARQPAPQPALNNSHPQREEDKKH